MGEIRRERFDPALEYLRRGVTLDMQIDAGFERIQQLRALAERRTTVYGHERVAGSGAADHRMDVVAKIVDAERELDAWIDRLIELRSQIQATISRLQDGRMRTLLELRYLNGQPWEQIAERMGYSTRNIYNLHNAALKAVAPLVAEAEGRSEAAV